MKKTILFLFSLSLGVTSAWADGKFYQFAPTTSIQGGHEYIFTIQDGDGGPNQFVLLLGNGSKSLVPWTYEVQHNLTQYVFSVTAINDGFYCLQGSGYYMYSNSFEGKATTTPTEASYKILFSTIDTANSHFNIRRPTYNAGMSSESMPYLVYKKDDMVGNVNGSNRNSTPNYIINQFEASTHIPQPMSLAGIIAKNTGNVGAPSYYPGAWTIYEAIEMEPAHMSYYVNNQLIAQDEGVNFTLPAPTETYLAAVPACQKMIGWTDGTKNYAFNEMYLATSGANIRMDAILVPNVTTFDGNGHGTPDASTIQQTSFTMPGCTANDGFDFLGWSLNSYDILPQMLAGDAYQPQIEQTFYAIYRPTNPTIWVPIEEDILHGSNWEIDACLFTIRGGMPAIPECYAFGFPPEEDVKIAQGLNMIPYMHGGVIVNPPVNYILSYGSSSPYYHDASYRYFIYTDESGNKYYLHDTQFSESTASGQQMPPTWQPTTNTYIFTKEGSSAGSSTHTTVCPDENAERLTSNFQNVSGSSGSKYAINQLEKNMALRDFWNGTITSSVPSSFTIWIPKDNVAYIHFNLDGGQCSTDVGIGYIERLPEPTKEGYHFMGWQAEDNQIYQAGNRYPTEGYITEQDVTLTAIFAKTNLVTWTPLTLDEMQEDDKIALVIEDGDGGNTKYAIRMDNTTVTLVPIDDLSDLTDDYLFSIYNLQKTGYYAPAVQLKSSLGYFLRAKAANETGLVGSVEEQNNDYLWRLTESASDGRYLMKSHSSNIYLEYYDNNWRLSTSSYKDQYASGTALASTSYAAAWTFYKQDKYAVAEHTITLKNAETVVRTITVQEGESYTFPSNNELGMTTLYPGQGLCGWSTQTQGLGIQTELEGYIPDQGSTKPIKQDMTYQAVWGYNDWKKVTSADELQEYQDTEDQYVLGVYSGSTMYTAGYAESNYIPALVSVSTDGNIISQLNSKSVIFKLNSIDAYYPHPWQFTTTDRFTSELRYLYGSSSNFYFKTSPSEGSNYQWRTTTSPNVTPASDLVLMCNASSTYFYYDATNNNFKPTTTASKAGNNALRIYRKHVAMVIFNSSKLTLKAVENKTVKTTTYPDVSAISGQTLPTPLTSTDSICLGWFTKEGVKAGNAGDTYVPKTASDTLYARFAKKCFVTLMNDDQFVAKVEAPLAHPFTFPTKEALHSDQLVPLTSAYSQFAGWAVSKAAGPHDEITGLIPDGGTTLTNLTGDTTYQAVWSKPYWRRTTTDDAIKEGHQYVVGSYYSNKLYTMQSLTSNSAANALQTTTYDQGVTFSDLPSDATIFTAQSINENWLFVDNSGQYLFCYDVNSSSGYPILKASLYDASSVSDATWEYYYDGTTGIYTIRASVGAYKYYPNYSSNTIKLVTTINNNTRPSYIYHREDSLMVFHKSAIHYILANGEEVIDSVIAGYPTPLYNVPSSRTPRDHMLKDWHATSVDGELVGTPGQDFIATTRDTTLYANFVPKYTVTLKNGSTILQKIDIEQAIAEYTLPTQEELNIQPLDTDYPFFVGWTDQRIMGEQKSFDTSIDAGTTVSLTQDITYYCVWKQSKWIRLKDIDDLTTDKEYVLGTYTSDTTVQMIGNLKTSSNTAPYNIKAVTHDGGDTITSLNPNTCIFKAAKNSTTWCFRNQEETRWLTQSSSYSYIYWNSSIGNYCYWVPEKTDNGVTIFSIQTIDYTTTKTKYYIYISSSSWKIRTSSAHTSSPCLYYHVPSYLVMHPVPTLELNETTTTMADITAAAAETSVEVHMTRNLVGGAYNTFCVPFSMNADEVAEVLACELYQADTVSNEDGITTIYFEETDAIEAGVPYLIRPDDDINTEIIFDDKAITATPQTVDLGTFEFRGVFVQTEIEATNNLILSTGDLLYRLIRDGNIKGMRAYFHQKTSSSAPIRYMIGRPHGITTDWNEVNGEDQLTKFIHNGQLLIRKNGKLYNALGAEIRK